MKRVPIFATILVALAVAAMIALGVWQLQRKHEKEALLAQLEANRHLPGLVSDWKPANLYRRSRAECGQVLAVTLEGGHDAAGKPGWRAIATCAIPVMPETETYPVQLGIASRPNAKPDWRGGAVTGYLTYAPDHQPLIAQLFTTKPKTLMLVADPPLAGLGANPPADLSSVPNNHLAYAVQWFVFAAIAAIIYAIALRRRGKV
jgi:cytochrome oxidase assembly protein ShyY1